MRKLGLRISGISSNYNTCDPRKMITSAKLSLTHKYSFYCPNFAPLNMSLSCLEWPSSPPNQITHILYDPPEIPPSLKASLDHQK